MHGNKTDLTAKQLESCFPYIWKFSTYEISPLLKFLYIWYISTSQNKFLHISYLSTSKISLYLKFLHMTKKSPWVMSPASATNMKYASTLPKRKFTMRLSFFYNISHLILFLPILTWSYLPSIVSHISAANLFFSYTMILRSLGQWWCWWS